MERKEVIINDIKYLFWNKFYWLPASEKIHDCDTTREPRKIIIYKKFRKWKGEMKEIKHWGGVCQACQTNY